MTIVEYYQMLKNQPHPAAEFILKMMEICHRQKLAVQNWCLGKTVPDPNIQEKIAEYTGIPVSELFPTSPEDKIEQSDGEQ